MKNMHQTLTELTTSQNLEFEFEFDRRTFDNAVVWNVLLSTTKEKKGRIIETTNTEFDIQIESSVNSVSVGYEFDLFKSTPQWCVGHTAAEICDVRKEDASLSIIYEELIAGVSLIRAKQNGSEINDKIVNKIESVISWIQSSSFYEMPASTIYHECVTGGLLIHTLKVYDEMLGMISVPKFADYCDIAGAALCCLVHDWCKIGLYEKYMKNVKNDDTGSWEKVEAFKRITPPFTLGHGVSSLFLAQKFFKLTIEESCAIRWHMSTWNVAVNEQDDLQQSNERYPLVHLVQFADQLSITQY